MDKCDEVSEISVEIKNIEITEETETVSNKDVEQTNGTLNSTHTNGEDILNLEDEPATKPENVANNENVANAEDVAKVEDLAIAEDVATAEDVAEVEDVNQVEAEPEDVANHISENVVTESVVKEVAEIGNKSESSAESEPIKVKIEKKEEFCSDDISIDSLDEDEFHDAIDEVKVIFIKTESIRVYSEI